MKALVYGNEPKNLKLFLRDGLTLQDVPTTVLVKSGAEKMTPKAIEIEDVERNSELIEALSKDGYFVVQPVVRVEFSREITMSVEKARELGIWPF